MLPFEILAALSFGAISPYVAEAGVAWLRRRRLHARRAQAPF